MLDSLHIEAKCLQLIFADLDLVLYFVPDTVFSISAF